mmetsp:Transcript_20622/g.38538  ORF Transcript_20622/g.38538 Transcript_20622/m.38538 type:complete len:342 (-) Transcript_20622:2420-3445(-)
MPGRDTRLASTAVALATTVLLPELSMLSELSSRVRSLATGLVGDEFCRILKDTVRLTEPEVTVSLTGRGVESSPCVMVAASEPVVAFVAVPAADTTALSEFSTLKLTGAPPTATRLASTEVTVAVIESVPELVIVALFNTTTRSAATALAAPDGLEAPEPGPITGVPALPLPPPQAARDSAKAPPNNARVTRQLHTSNFIISIAPVNRPAQGCGTPSFEGLASTHRGALADDLGRQEDQQLGLAGRASLVLEQIAEHGHIAQQRHFVDGLAFVLGVDAADDHRTTVLDQHLSLGMLGVDRIALGRQGAAAVFVDIDIQDDAALGGDLRRHFQFEIGLAECD